MELILKPITLEIILNMSHQGILFWDSATKEREAQLENYEFRDNFQKILGGDKEKIYTTYT